MRVLLRVLQVETRSAGAREEPPRELRQNQAQMQYMRRNLYVRNEFGRPQIETL